MKMTKLTLIYYYLVGTVGTICTYTFTLKLSRLVIPGPRSGTGTKQFFNFNSLYVYLPKYLLTILTIYYTNSL